MATIKGGAKLQAELAKLSVNLQRGRTLRVGFLEKASYPDGKPVAMIAAIQDFGAPRAGIPPRPFFRNMVAAKKGGWPAALGKLLKQENYDGKRALSLMGAGIRGQLQQSIRDTNSPPLKPATIRRKGFSKPLIDTSHMINSVDYDVK